MADAHLDALRYSVARLRGLAAEMTEAELEASAYPTEWTVADVLSHIGSGGVILQRRLEPSPAPTGPDVQLPAEAFARLVYGRLDRDHTPPGIESPTLDVLRHVFPGP